MEPTAFSLKDLSNDLEISIRILRDYIKQGTLSASKVGRSYMVTEDALNDFLDMNVVLSRYGLGKG